MGKFQPGDSRAVLYPQKGKDAATAPAPNKQFSVKSFAATNRTGSAIDVGLLRKYPNAKWVFGEFDESAAAGSEVTERTAAAQDTAQAVTLFTTTNDDGFVVSSRDTFGLVGMTISQIQTGSPVFAFEYFNGTAFTALTLIETPVFTSTGDVFLAFLPPHDWVAGGLTDAAVAGQFQIRATATTASTQAVLATELWVAEFFEFQPNLPNEATLSISYPEEKPLDLDGGEGLMPYYGTANANNFVSFIVSVK